MASKAKSIDTNNWGFPKAKHCLCTIIKTHQASWSLFRACPSNVNTQPRIFKYLTKVFHTKRQRHPTSSKKKKKKKMKKGNKDSIGTRSIETTKYLYYLQSAIISMKINMFFLERVFFLMFFETKNIIVEMKKN